MLRHFRSAGRKPTRRLASTLAMAAALAGGSIVASAGLAVPAAAQEYSRAFVALYSPVAEAVNAPEANVAAISAQFPAIIAAAVSPDEKFATGNLILIAGNKASNPAWQRQGLELQLASGLVPPEQVGQFNWFVGSLAYNAGDYDASRAALQRAAQAGFADGDVNGLIAETYYQSDQTAEGLAYVMAVVESTTAAGQPVPQQWLLRGLQAAYGDNLIEQALDFSLLLVTHHASQENWLRALQVTNAVAEIDDQARLDVLRLMRLTDTLTDGNEYIAYIEAADPRIMSNELDDVLSEGVAAGRLSADDTYYQEVKYIIDARKAADRADAPALVADARASATGRDALAAGDVLLSLDDFAGAAEMYAMAVTKGGVDTAAALTRQGIAQVRSGDYAGAQATLSQVTGPRAIVAKLWAAYAAAQG